MWTRYHLVGILTLALLVRLSLFPFQHLIQDRIEISTPISSFNRCSFMFFFLCFCFVILTFSFQLFSERRIFSLDSRQESLCWKRISPTSFAVVAVQLGCQSFPCSAVPAVRLSRPGQPVARLLHQPPALRILGLPTACADLRPEPVLRGERAGTGHHHPDQPPAPRCVLSSPQQVSHRLCLLRSNRPRHCGLFQLRPFDPRHSSQLADQSTRNFSTLLPWVDTVDGGWVVLCFLPPHGRFVGLGLGHRRIRDPAAGADSQHGPAVVLVHGAVHRVHASLPVRRAGLHPYP